MALSLNFTDRAIGGLPPATNSPRLEYADTKTTGLRLRVSSTGIKTFSLLRRVKNGPLERLTLGRFPGVKTEQARSDALQLIGLIASGANPAEIRRAHRGEPTFGEFFTDYIEDHAKLRKRSWRDDEQKYRHYLSPKLGNKKLSKISRHDITAIHSAITRAGHPVLANRVKALISSVLGQAVKADILDSNAARGIKANREHSRERFLQPGELPRLFKALAAETPVFRDFFLLALLTGARRANIRMMRWADLDLDSATWRIPLTKNGEPQSVPLVPEAVSVLRARRDTVPDECPFVFPASRSDSRLGHLSGERKAWVRIVNSAQLNDVRIHDLRRTLGSWQARGGTSMVIIGKSLGHKSHQTTQIYARLDIDPVRAAMGTATTAMLEAGRVGTDAAQQPATDSERAPWTA